MQGCAVLPCGMLAPLPARAAAGSSSLQHRQQHQVVGAAGRQLRRVGLANGGERWLLAGWQQVQQSKTQRSRAWRCSAAVLHRMQTAPCAGAGIVTAVCAAVGCLLSAAARQSRTPGLQHFGTAVPCAARQLSRSTAAHDCSSCSMQAAHAVPVLYCPPASQWFVHLHDSMPSVSHPLCCPAAVPLPGAPH